MSEEYDLKKSEKTVGQILPVIKDARGRIVDGLHRKDVDSNWREEIREEIDTDEKYWVTRAHLNYARRNPHEAKREKIQIVDNLAEYYIKQGLNVAGRQRLADGKGAPINEVLEAVIQALNGAISESWIRHNINPKYTQDQKPQEKPKHYSEERPAVEILESDKASVTNRYGKGFVKRLKDEIRKDVQDEIAFKYDIPELFTEDKKEKIEPKIKQQEIREIGKELGKGVKKALIRLDKDIKATKPKREYVSNLISIQLIKTKLNTGELFNPFDRKSTLVWSSGHTLEETEKELEKIMENKE